MKLKPNKIVRNKPVLLEIFFSNHTKQTELKKIQKVDKHGSSKDGFIIPAGGHTGDVSRNMANPIMRVANNMVKETSVTIMATDEIICCP